jgi:hypothetical protein
VPLHVAELEFDEHEAEMARHGVSAIEVFQVLEADYRLFRNKRNRAAEYVMIGVSYGGRLLTVPLARTAVPGRWRPATAWESSTAERTRYES